MSNKQKQLVIFQLQRVSESRFFLDKIVNAIESDSEWDLSEIILSNSASIDSMEKTLKNSLTDCDLLIAHLTDWNAYQGPTSFDCVPQDCVWFTTQTGTPIELKKANGCDKAFPCAPARVVAAHIGGILEQGSQALIRSAKTEKAVFNLVEALSPYCFLEPGKSLESLVSDGTVSESLVQELIGNEQVDGHVKIEDLWAKTPSEVILEFRGFL